MNQLKKKINPKTQTNKKNQKTLAANWYTTILCLFPRQSERKEEIKFNLYLPVPYHRTIHIPRSEMRFFQDAQLNLKDFGCHWEFLKFYFKKKPCFCYSIEQKMETDVQRQYLPCLDQYSSFHHPHEEIHLCKNSDLAKNACVTGMCLALT